MGKTLKEAMIDFFGMCASGAVFLLGLYLVYIKEHPILAVFLIISSMTFAGILSIYDITVVEESTPEPRVLKTREEEKIAA